MRFSCSGQRWDIQPGTRRFLPPTVTGQSNTLSIIDYTFWNNAKTLSNFLDILFLMLKMNSTDIESFSNWKFMFKIYVRRVEVEGGEVKIK